MKTIQTILSSFLLLFGAFTASTPRSAPVSGSQSFVSILCKFSSVTAEPKSRTYFEGMFSDTRPGLGHYWREVSYNKINLQGSAVVGWYTLPHDMDYYFSTSDYLYFVARDCTAAADSDVDFTVYKGINLFFNAEIDGNSYGGPLPIELDGLSKDWPATWIPPNGYTDLVVVAHEMGHAFGLPHSRGAGAYNYPVGNQWDVMSDMWSNCYKVQHPVYGCLPQGPIAYNRHKLGWLVGRVYTAKPGGATITIEQLELPKASSYLMVKIPISGTKFYTVEVRTLVGYDKKLPKKAVVIHLVDMSKTSIMDTPAALIKSLTKVGDRWQKGNVSVTVVSVSATSFKVLIQRP